MVDRSANKIREMFGQIAPRYDLVNRVLSLSIDRYWRWRTRRRMGSLLPPGSGPLLDLCTGTGDLAIELSRLGSIVGCDFSHPMLIRAGQKTQKRQLDAAVSLVEGDALCLPFSDQIFRGLSVAFGFRNMEDYAQGLAEMNRVLRTGGTLAILEFSEPGTPGFKQLYQWYFRKILPLIGRLISGQNSAYSYLPESVREFPPPLELSRLLRNAQFHSVVHHRLSMGIATLTLARKTSPIPKQTSLTELPEQAQPESERRRQATALRGASPGKADSSR